MASLPNITLLDPLLNKIHQLLSPFTSVSSSQIQGNHGNMNSDNVAIDDPIHAHPHEVLERSNCSPANDLTGDVPDPSMQAPALVDTELEEVMDVGPWISQDDGRCPRREQANGATRGPVVSRYEYEGYCPFDTSDADRVTPSWTSRNVLVGASLPEDMIFEPSTNWVPQDEGRIPRLERKREPIRGLSHREDLDSYNLAVQHLLWGLCDN